MQESKQIIELSEHVKNKIKSHRITPLSFSSDEFNLSENDSPSPLVRRSSTFVTYRIQQCQECLRRENILREENQRLVRLYQENRTLSEQFRSSILLNRQYQEENDKLKQELTKMNIRLQEYQMNFNLLKQKLTTFDRIKQDFEADEIKRLRHEIQIYNQVILTKRKEEQKPLDYFSQFRKK